MDNSKKRKSILDRRNKLKKQEPIKLQANEDIQLKINQTKRATMSQTFISQTPNSNNFTYVTSEDNIQVPVPTGYVASPLTTGFTYTDTLGTQITISDGGERTVNRGFVIYEKNAGETDAAAISSINSDPWTAQKTRNQYDT